MKLALMGDTMLGRGVAERLATIDPRSLVAPEVRDAAAEADLRVLNLECCISDRGSPWADPRKPFFFRAPPNAVEFLSHLGVDAVTLANNHALDFGYDALTDTLAYLDDVGIAHVGAGHDLEAARAPATLEHDGFRLGLVGFTDHPAAFAATTTTPGVAYTDLRDRAPDWVPNEIGSLDTDAVLVMAHWGPNMRQAPLGYVRSAAAELVDAGATLVAGHSAHVFHGVAAPVLYDLGDFIDDYATDPVMRNDLGLLWLVTLGRSGPTHIEVVPLKLDYCHTLIATGGDAEWIRRRFVAACAQLGTEVEIADDRLTVLLD
ncbi:MAG: CapA family protein [Actinomycetota bacterium]|nr:CapA family protein [Actinomycetota bacterium]